MMIELCSVELWNLPTGLCPIESATNLALKKIFKKRRNLWNSKRRICASEKQTELELLVFNSTEQMSCVHVKRKLCWDNLV